MSSQVSVGSKQREGPAQNESLFSSAQQTRRYSRRIGSKCSGLLAALILGMAYRAHQSYLLPIFGHVILHDGGPARASHLFIILTLLDCFSPCTLSLRFSSEGRRLVARKRRSSVLLKNYNAIALYPLLIAYPVVDLSPLGPFMGPYLITVLLLVPLVEQVCLSVGNGLGLIAVPAFNLGYHLALDGWTYTPPLLAVMIVIVSSRTVGLSPPGVLGALTVTMFFMSLMLLVQIPFKNTFHSLQLVKIPISLRDNRTDATFRTIAHSVANSGYVGVIEGDYDSGASARWLRSDHSLLGGQWTNNELHLPAPEPVFGVFAMMESVRLVERSSNDEDRQEKCLNIGLGIGTTANALIQHGVNVTVVELDPFIVKAAQEFFRFPKEGLVRTVIEDALVFVNQAQEDATEVKSYDYIVHDLFSGGSVPFSLYTLEFLRSLRRLMRPDAILALNFVGDLSHESARITLRTVLQAFDGQCRSYLENPASDSPPEEEQATAGNQVIFCRQAPPGQDAHVRFRHPVAEDFLKSGIRQEWLMPHHEFDLSILNSGAEGGKILRDGEIAGPSSPGAKLLSWVNLIFNPFGGTFPKQNPIFTSLLPYMRMVNPALDLELILTEGRLRGARMHWRVMRQLMPSSVWINW